MKTHLLLLPLALASLSSCGMLEKVDQLNCLVNQSTATIWENVSTVQTSTEIIRENAELIDQSTAAIVENNHHLTELSKQ